MHLSGPPFCSLTYFYCANIQRQFFSVFIASFMLKIVQNTKKGIYSLMSKLFSVENDFLPRYKTMNNKTKEIG